MNTIVSKILKPIIFLFVLGLLGTLYFLYDLPNALENSSPLISHEAIGQTSSVLIKLSLVVIITLVLGLSYIIISLRNKREKEVIEKIVYIDKNKTEDIDNKDEEKLDEIDKIKINEIIQAVKKEKTLQSKKEMVIQELCSKIEASQGLLYSVKKSGNKRILELAATYAFSLPDSSVLTYEFGEGLAGQAAKEGKTKKVTDIPEDYMAIVSGLGSAAPRNLLIQPILIDNNVFALVEIASFKEFSSHDEKVINEVIQLIGKEIAQSENKSEGGKIEKISKSPPKKKTND